mmetsp:Transcript_53212/g.173065  ORF Transcript_53212/g.173065 Transcript_53212/m.173065 type:complete len:192 (-) Transcript_53212:11-586(-)
MAEVGVGPLGVLHGMSWDPKRNRYFKSSAAQGAAAAAASTVAGAAVAPGSAASRGGGRHHSRAGGEAVSSPAAPGAPVESLPVSADVVERLRTLRFSGRGRGRAGGPEAGPYSLAEGAGRRGGSAYTTCAVCLEPFIAGERLPQLPACGHMFHKACLGPWLARRGSCPSCRAPVDVALHAAQRAAESSAPP